MGIPLSHDMLTFLMNECMTYSTKHPSATCLVTVSMTLWVFVCILGTRVSGLRALHRQTFHLVGSGIQISNLSVTGSTLLTARLPAEHYHSKISVEHNRWIRLRVILSIQYFHTNIMADDHLQLFYHLNVNV